jgi:hypothetical protein
VSICFGGFRLSAQFRDALRAAHQVVEQRADPMGENYDQDPNQFVVAATGLPGRALDDHNDPEDSACYPENQKEESTQHG